jgi:hypothetical protein
MEVSGELHAPAALPPEKEHWIGGRMGPRVGLDAVAKRKILTLPVIELGPSSP